MQISKDSFKPFAIGEPWPNFSLLHVEMLLINTETVLNNYDDLIKLTKQKLPDTEIVISEALPRFQKDLDWRDTYESKRQAFNQGLEIISNKYNCHLSTCPHIKEQDVVDGIHINDRSGLPKLIRSYKSVTNSLLGMKDTYQTPESNYNQYQYDDRHSQEIPYETPRPTTRFQSDKQTWNSHDTYNGFDQNESFVDYNHGFKTPSQQGYDYYKENKGQLDPTKTTLKWFFKSFLQELS